MFCNDILWTLLQPKALAGDNARKYVPLLPAAKPTTTHSASQSSTVQRRGNLEEGNTPLCGNYHLRCACCTLCFGKQALFALLHWRWQLTMPEAHASITPCQQSTFYASGNRCRCCEGFTCYVNSHTHTHTRASGNRPALQRCSPGGGLAMGLSTNYTHEKSV